MRDTLYLQPEHRSKSFFFKFQDTRLFPTILPLLLHLLIKLIYSLSPVYYVEESCTINLEPPRYIKKKKTANKPVRLEIILLIAVKSSRYSQWLVVFSTIPGTQMLCIVE